MTKRPEITIRFGASNDDISVDGQVFRRGDLNRSQQTLMRNVVIGALVQSGAVVPNSPIKSPRFRSKRNKSKKVSAQ